MIEKILKAEKEERLILGVKETQKALMKGAIEEIYLAATCPKLVQAEIENLAAMASVAVTKLDLNAEELAAKLKKPFSISVVGIKKR
jgi:ribosomal protein L30E